MKRLIITCVVVALLIPLVFLGCSTSGTSTSSTPPSTSQVKTTTAANTPTAATQQYGGVLKISYATSIINIGVPWLGFGPSDGPAKRPCVQTLIDMDKDGKLFPSLATAWEYSPDYKTLTFTLRKGVKFHDGTDFNAQAAKYNFDQTKASKTSQDLKYVSSVEVLNDYTIRLGFSEYDPIFMNRVIGLAGVMVSPAAIEKLGVDESKLHPVGTGPFEFVSYERDVSLKYKKFAGYWEKGKPYLDGIEFVCIADPVVRKLSFLQGNEQAMLSVGVKDASEIVATGKYGTNPSFTNFVGLVGDSANPDSPFANIKVRQAMAYAIDNAALTKRFGYGFTKPTNQFTISGDATYNPAVVGYSYDPQKAKQLLTEAGYANGLSTKLSYSSAASGANDLWTAVQGYFKEVGIQVTLDPADPGRFQTLTTGGWKNQLVAYDMMYGKAIDIGQALYLFMSGTGFKFSSKSLWIPPDYEAKLAEAYINKDSQKRKALFQDLQKMIVDQYCIAIPFYLNASPLAFSLSVHDLDLNIVALHVYHPENTWLSK